MVGRRNDPGIMELVDIGRRIEIDEEIQELFNELYGAIDSVRAETQYLARNLRHIFHGSSDQNQKDGWQSRIMP